MAWCILYVTVTERPKTCAWCGEAIIAGAAIGRPRRYCRRSHRQRAYEARRLAEQRQIHPDEVLVLRSTWDRLKTALGDLQGASKRVVGELADVDTVDAGYVEAVAGLAVAITELQELAEPAAQW